MRAFIVRQPLASFFGLAYLFSWAAWAVPALGYRDGIGAALFLAGSFGPLLAAATVIRLSGDSVREWFKGLFVWRVPAR